jgi:hypothetical protein
MPVRLRRCKLARNVASAVRVSLPSGIQVVLEMRCCGLWLVFSAEKVYCFMPGKSYAVIYFRNSTWL